MINPMFVPHLREDAEEIIARFISERVNDAAADGVSIGLSGGLDSSVAADLCARALGRDRVLGVMMPESQSDPIDFDHAKLLAAKIGIEHIVVDISEPMKTFSETFSEPLDEFENKLSMANLKARTRMVVLYYIANGSNRLVCGCGNKTELMMGYFTKFGDGAADFLPIGDLYKTQVREMAERLGVPDEIRKKLPSAGLWRGQTDEEEFGMSYELLDEILYGFEKGLTRGEISQKAECDISKVEMVGERIRRSVHKRRLPLIPKIGLRTPGFDWREF